MSSNLDMFTSGSTKHRKGPPERSQRSSLDHKRSLWHSRWLATCDHSVVCSSNGTCRFWNESVHRSSSKSSSHSSAPKLTLRVALIWSMTTVLVNGATFRPDHIALLGERPAMLHLIIDINDSMATCDYNRKNAVAEVPKM